MKNIQIIDGAENCTYSLFAATEDEFSAIFVGNTDVEFAEDFFDRVGERRGIEISEALWKRPVAKKEVQGIHGTLFYQLPYKKKYYPTRRESEIVVG